MAALPFDCWCEIAGYLAPLDLKRLRACSRVCRDAADHVIASRAYGEALVDRIVDRLLEYHVKWGNAIHPDRRLCPYGVAPNFEAYDECWESGWTHPYHGGMWMPPLYLAYLGRSGIRNIFSERGDPETATPDMCFCRLVNTCYRLALLILSSTRAPELHLDAKLALEWAGTFQRGGCGGAASRAGPGLKCWRSYTKTPAKASSWL